MADLQRIKKKLARLTERTVERGFTEQEAMSAAAMVQEIMAENGLTMADVESARAEGFKLFAAPYDVESKIIHEVHWTSVAVSEFTDTVAATVPSPLHPGGEVMTFFGFEADVTAAMTLYHFIRKAMDNAYGLHLTSQTAKNEKGRGIGEYTIRHNFMVGMAGRLSERLREMKNKPTTESRALVVLKKDTIEQAIDQTGLKETDRALATYQPGLESFRDGVKKGDEVPLTPLVGDTKKLAPSKKSG